MTILAIFKAKNAVWVFAVWVVVNTAIGLLYYRAYLSKDWRRSHPPSGSFERPSLPERTIAGKGVFWRNESFTVGKVILMWTGWFKYNNWEPFIDLFNGPFVLGNKDSSEDCFLTTNRSLMDDASVVVFHERNLNFRDLPKERNPSQRWIYYTMETPTHSSSLRGSGPKKLKGMNFNWTITYHRNSDVFSPYFYLVRTNVEASNWWHFFHMEDEQDRTIKSFSNGFTKRSRDALWYVSNCGGDRWELAKMLMNNGISVDMFGACSRIGPEEVISEIGESSFYLRYKFYLSFENGLCDDYVTEKFKRGLQLSKDYGIIPIVYGANVEGYERIAPNGSYIFAESFPNVTALATYLRYLKTTESMAAGYYQWHKNYAIPTPQFMIPQVRNLCQKIFLEDKTGCRANALGNALLQPCQPLNSSVPDVLSKVGQCRKAFLTKP